jgi:steroid delta-isomerase-like uncharacterized protein
MLLSLALTLTLGCNCRDECAQLDQNKQLVQQAFDAIMAGELDGLEAYFATDYQRHSQSSPVAEMTSLEQFVAWLAADRETFPDTTGTLDMMVAEGDLVAVWGTFSGTQQGALGPFPADGGRVKLDWGGVHRIEEGKIVETWVTWDNLTALAQLGHFPPSGEAPEERR